MKNYIELNEKDIQMIIADYYNIPIEEKDKKVEINLNMVTKGYGEGEHLEPSLYARVFFI